MKTSFVEVVIMKRLMGIVIILILISSVIHPESGKQKFVEKMKKLEPFIGKWQTISRYPGKELSIPGKLEYCWVLGKNWLKLEFIGQHPERSFWESYEMTQFDVSKNCYIVYAFYSADTPTIMMGTWISDQTLRCEVKDKKGEVVEGIDYTIKKDGSIYQENWRILKDKKKKITLKTEYTKLK